MSYNSFAKSLGMANGTGIKTMVDNNRNPQNQTLNKIAQAYPDINMNWLKTGIGEMVSEAVKTNNEDLTVTAKQIIDRLEFDKGYYDNKLKEDRLYYNSSDHWEKLLDGFEMLEKKIENYAETATTRVVKIMMEGMAEQNKMLIDGYAKVQKLESELEDIKTFMAAKFELQKMKKKKAKEIKKLTPR